MDMKRFADFWRGVFFLLASIALAVVLWMFVTVWQPIWTEGFKDFHTISEAIDRLDETAKPAAQVAPDILVQISQMNSTMKNMQSSMVEMKTSVRTLEQMNPNLLRVNQTMQEMNYSLNAQIHRMNYHVDEIEDKFSPFGMMPFNW